MKSVFLSKIKGLFFSPGGIKNTFNTSRKCRFSVSGSLYSLWYRYYLLLRYVLFSIHENRKRTKFLPELVVYLKFNHFPSNKSNTPKHIYQVWKPITDGNISSAETNNCRNAAHIYFYVRLLSVICDDLPASLKEPSCPDALIGSLPSPFCFVRFIRRAFFFFLGFWGNIDQIHSRISYF